MHAFIAQAGQQPGGGSGTFLISLVLLGVVFYFLMIRPQQKRARHQRETIASLEVGDEVMTSGGIFGTIRELDDETVTVEISPGTRIRMAKQAVARKLVDEGGEGAGSGS